MRMMFEVAATLIDSVLAAPAEYGILHIYTQRFTHMLRSESNRFHRSHSLCPYWCEIGISCCFFLLCIV